MQIVPLPLASCFPSLLYSKKETVSGKDRMLMKEKSRLRVWFNSLSLRVMAGTIFLTLTAALFIGALAGMFIRRHLKDQLAAQSRQQA